MLLNVYIDVLIEMIIKDSSFKYSVRDHGKFTFHVVLGGHVIFSVTAR